MMHAAPGTALLIAVVSAAAAWAADTATVVVDAAAAGPPINPRMYGIFLEEINHGVDGGLYAELVRNRGFEDARAPEGYVFRDGRWVDQQGFDSGFAELGYVTDGLPFWSLVQEGDTEGAIHLEKTGGITKQSPYCLRLEAKKVRSGRIGVANRGFFGIGVRQGERYSLSFYARGSAGYHGPLSVRLEDASGRPCSDAAVLSGIGNDWRQYSATLTASKTEPNSRLVITTNVAGQVWLDFVSLFPETTWEDRPNGFRADIAQMIADLQPGFVRFPGGCVVEGGTVETAYNWKLTVGPLEEREERWGPWHYRRTHGTGLYEYLQFCEDLGAEPLWVGFAGQSCIYREREHVPMDEMDWVRDNFLDLVEYANGSADSKWGAIRAAAGRPQPFGLKYVEIGNENANREYEERYRFIYETMKRTYPDLTYLADVSYYRMPPELYDVADQHYYNNPNWFLARYDQYDDRDRGLPPLYLGEVAVTSQHGGRYRGNLLAALAEGVYLMGCERNSDVVTMVSYAPLLAHVSGRSWNWHGMIYHDNTRVFGTVSYHLWRLLSENRPDYSLQSAVEQATAKPQVIAGQIGVGTWDATAEFTDIRVERGGKAVYAADFAEGADGWQTERGRWSVDAGSYRQSRRGYGLSYFGDPEWSDYTLTLKARKSSGGEGFLIVVGRQGADKYWWNLGGWGNRQHAIEMNQNLVGQPARGRIETDRWYDVKIELSGNRIRCYLDGELVHDATSTPPPKFFVIAGRDTTNSELVLKAINLAADPLAANLQLRGVNKVAPEASATVLRSESLSDNNSLDRPNAVVPAETQISGVGAEFAHEFPPYSLTVLRLKVDQK